jgi:hypothetical protein
MKTPQADGSSEPLSRVEQPEPPPRPARKKEKKQLSEEEASEAGDAHLGATEDQVSDTSAPAGEAYKDEPKQG